MVELRFESYELRASDPGPNNPLPRFDELEKHPATDVRFDDRVPLESRETFVPTDIPAILPYHAQDLFTRDAHRKTLTAAILENDHLRAVFLPELGGRLWSLFDKTANRELLHQPETLRIANLAIRGAWFCGGVEWNVSVFGHCAHTCSPVYAAQVQRDDGSPLLRLYEYDRFRGVCYQIDCWLDDNHRYLFIRPRIQNTNDHAVQMYWWSNATVSGGDGCRVLAPGDVAWYHDDPSNAILHYDLCTDSNDTFASRAERSSELYYVLPDHQRPWSSAINDQGDGIVCLSGARLFGRKQFVWGTHEGGRRWHEYLGGEGEPYVEIQSGLTRTQLEYTSMPAHSELAWLEAYGPVRADPSVACGDDWSRAWRSVDRIIQSDLPDTAFNKIDADAAHIARQPPDDIVLQGSGWGSLETIRRNMHRCPPLAGPEIPFPECAINDDQRPWLRLLREGALQERGVNDEPGHWMCDMPWHEMLKRSVASGSNDHWLTQLHLGVMLMSRGDTRGARSAWAKSIEHQPSCWALRNLAQLELSSGNTSAAFDIFFRAIQAAPNQVSIAIEFSRVLMEHGTLEQINKFLAEVDATCIESPRIQVLKIKADIARGHLKDASDALMKIDLPDVREGETILTDLWFALQEKEAACEQARGQPSGRSAAVASPVAPPHHLDFRKSEYGQDP